MANNRIRWQQVAAPDFSDAARMQAQAGNAFSAGFKGLSAAIGGIQDRREAATEKANFEASADAINRAMMIQDSDQWAQLAQGEGGALGGLGISAAQATPEVMNFLTGRKANLQAGEINNLNMAAKKQAMKGIAYDQDRREVIDTRSDIEKAEQKAEQERLSKLDNDARDAAHQFGLKHGNDAAAMVVNSTNMSPEMKEAVLGKLENGPDFTQTTEEAQIAAEDLAGDIPVMISEARADIARRYGSDDLQMYIQSRDLYGSGAMNYGDMSNRLQELYKPEDDDKTSFHDSFGKVEALHKKYKGKYDKLNDAIIASVMETEIARRGFWSSKVKLDTPEIQRKLEQLNDDMSNNAFRQDYLAMNKELDKQEKTEKALQKAQSDYALAHTRGDAEGMANAIKRIDDFRSEFTGGNQDLNQIAATFISGTPFDPIGVGGSADPSFAGRPMGTVPAPSTDATTDSRGAFNNAATNLDRTQAFQQGALDYGRNVAEAHRRVGDRLVGGVAGAGANSMANIISGLGYGVGLAHPETGASILGHADEMRSVARDAFDKGIIGYATSSEEPRTNPADVPAPVTDKPMVEWAQEDPSITMELVATVADMAPRETSDAQRAATALKNGEDPMTGRALTDEEFVEYRQFLKNFMRKAKGKLKGDMDSLSPEIKSLINMDPSIFGG